MDQRSNAEVVLRKLIHPKSKEGQLALHVLKLIQQKVNRGIPSFRVDDLWALCRIKADKANFIKTVYFLASPEICFLSEAIDYYEPETKSRVGLGREQLAQALMARTAICPLTGKMLTPKEFGERITIRFTVNDIIQPVAHP